MSFKLLSNLLLPDMAFDIIWNYANVPITKQEVQQKYTFVLYQLKFKYVHAELKNRV